MLEGCNVALGVTGSIGAVKTVELAHELRRRGADVRAVCSSGARSIINPWALEYATGTDVVTELTGAVEHVELCGVDGWADVFLIAPATANTMGKIASAIDDTPVTTCATTALGADVPIVIGPAMHEPMYDHPGVLDAIERLESWGVEFVEPRIEEGKAKIASEAMIVLETARAAGESPLADAHIVVSSGATTERIDPVRVLTSRASGKTGRAVARACYARGATVTLVHQGASVPYAETRQVESAEEMHSNVLIAASDADAFVSAAAVGDYTVERRDEKIRSGAESLSLTLEPTPKIIDAVRDSYPTLPIVGFKAESRQSDDADPVIEPARELLERVELDFVVANHTAVMGEDSTRATLVFPGETTTVEGSKAELGLAVVDALAPELE